jgi:hypothetical protein
MRKSEGCGFLLWNFLTAKEREKGAKFENQEIGNAFWLFQI